MLTYIDTAYKKIIKKLYKWYKNSRKCWQLRCTAAWCRLTSLQSFRTWSPRPVRISLQNQQFFKGHFGNQQTSISSLTIFILHMRRSCYFRASGPPFWIWPEVDYHSCAAFETHSAPAYKSAKWQCAAALFMIEQIILQVI